MVRRSAKIYFLWCCLLAIAVLALGQQADDDQSIIESAADDAQETETMADDAQETKVTADDEQKAVEEELLEVAELADKLEEDLMDERKRMRMELDDENFVGLAPLVMGTIMGEPDMCAEYTGQCNDTYHCCQYFGRGKVDCIEGRCLQGRCGMPGHHCGIFFGDCCFHLGLQCQGNGFRGKCRLARMWDQ